MARATKSEPFSFDDESRGNGTDTSSANSGSGDNGDGPATIDPATISGAADGNDGDDSGTVKRKRGRPAGSRNRSTAQKGPALDVNGLEFILLNMHGMLAGITRIPELEMDATEAKTLAVAAANVARHYNMTMTAKAMDWTALCMVIGQVYGTRLMAIRLRRMQERTTRQETPQEQPRPSQAQSRQSPNGNVVDIPGVGRVAVN